jgi:hypothetical protein
MALRNFHVFCHDNRADDHSVVDISCVADDPHFKQIKEIETAWI